MIRIGILGEIGAGKTYISKNFGYPVFNADYEVAQLYKYNKKIFSKLKKKYQNIFIRFQLIKKKFQMQS